MSDPGCKDRFGTQACTQCGAREIIPDAHLSSANPMLIAAYGRPDAKLFKKMKHSKVRAGVCTACVCTACVYIDFYARDPATLREAFDEAHDRY